MNLKKSIKWILLFEAIQKRMINCKLTIMKFLLACLPFWAALSGVQAFSPFPVNNFESVAAQFQKRSQSMMNLYDQLLESRNFLEELSDEFQFPDMPSAFESK